MIHTSPGAYHPEAVEQHTTARINEILVKCRVPELLEVLVPGLGVSRGQRVHNTPPSGR